MPYVSHQLGHASVAITEKHYTRWIPQAVSAVHQLDDEPSGNKTAGLLAAPPLTLRLCRRLGDSTV